MGKLVYWRWHSRCRRTMKATGRQTGFPRGPFICARHTEHTALTFEIPSNGLGSPPKERRETALLLMASHLIDVRVQSSRRFRWRVCDVCKDTAMARKHSQLRCAG